MKIKKSGSDMILDTFVFIIIALSVAATLYPIIYTISMSISDPVKVSQNAISFLPKGFSIESYKMVFKDKKIWTAYGNTIWYTVVGTLVNIFMTLLAAYPLSRKAFFLRKPLMKFVTFTMFFNGGLIPFFILVNNLGLYNSRWAVIIPFAINTWNLIICRSFFEGIPESLEEAARIDGASQLNIFTKIFIPLSMPVIAVLVLFYAVYHWNSYFHHLLFINDSSKLPLQTYLREILVVANASSLSGAAVSGVEKSMMSIQLKYSVIIVSILPIICVYPFLQKYFVTGVMVGAVKE